jgi:ABC-2 type transport system permease protein
VLSAIVAVLISFGCRYLLNASAFWLLDLRGANLVWLLVTNALSGLLFPLHFLPGWLAAAVWLLTPFPSILMTPLDVLVERQSAAGQVGLIGLQFVWATAVLGACALVQRRAERRLVIQGG